MASETLHNLDNIFSLQNTISALQMQLAEAQRQLFDCRSQILDLERNSRMLEREVHQRLDHLESISTKYVDEYVSQDDEDYGNNEDYDYCDCGEDYCDCNYSDEGCGEEGIVENVRRFEPI